MADNPASASGPVAYDFPSVCADAILREKTARMARSETMLRSDLIKVIREQDVLRLDKPQPAPAKGKRATPEPFGDRRRIPPLPEWVTAYSASIGYPMDGAKWCDSYEQKGWAVGKTRMKDWQCAVRNWKTNGYGSNGIATGPVKTKAASDYTKI